MRTNKGITLVALVVTIIVLIILAGISINLILGQDGIITKAKQAKENMEFAQVEEESQLKILDMQLKDAPQIAMTSWEYNYIGEIQNFSVPYKGIYKLEIFGAQGESYENYVGGKGGKVSANIELEKDLKLNIIVGGQDGYYGGGIGNLTNGGDYSAVYIDETVVAIAGGGGGATKGFNGGSAGIIESGNNNISLKGSSDSSINAAGGGAGYYGGTSGHYHVHLGDATNSGDCYKTEVAHVHSGNSSSGGACYIQSGTKTCGGTMVHSWTANDGDPNSYVMYYKCNKCGYTKAWLTGTCTRTVANYVLNCSKTIDSYKLSCTEIEEDIKSYGGSNYIGNSTLENTQISEAGVKEGNGYIKITLVELL